MKIRLYLNEWFYNMGLVGLMRLFNFANIDYIARDNYIEFDSESLIGLERKYFEYFITKEYDFDGQYIRKIGTIMEKFKKGENLDEVYKQGKDFIKKLKEKIKNTSIVDYMENYSKEYDSLKKHVKNSIDKIIEILSGITDLIDTNEIREKFGTNYTRSILYDNYFGQVSFLQKTMAGKQLDEQIAVLFKDYIFPIIFDIQFKNEIKINIEQAEMFLNDNIIFLKNERQKIYKDYIKEMKNGKSSQDILSIYHNCSFCNQYISYDQEFSEGMFLALGISNDNAQNFIWNSNSKFPICDLCKLVLFLSPIGATRMYSYSDKEEKQVYVNLDTDIKTLFEINETFKNRVKNKNSTFNELLIDIVKQYKTKADWTLQNILFIEFSAKYQSKKSTLYYFHIPRFLTLFFKFHAESTISYISNIAYKYLIVDALLKHKSLDKFIFMQIQNLIKSNKGSKDIYYSVLAKCLLNYYKNNQRGDIKVIYYKINSVYKSGIEMAKYLKEKNQENKINSIAYRILNAAKVGNKKELMDTLLRLYINAEKTIPKEFLDIFNQREVDAEALAQSFIAGLISLNKKESEDIQNNQKEVEIDE